MHKDDAINALKPMLRTGKAIKTTTDYGRGMTDYVRVFISHKGEVRDITMLAAAVIGARLDDEGRIKMGGYGYSKGFEVVYRLGRALRPDFRCTGTHRCPSNDHFNERRDPDGYRRGRRHSDGGYAFRHAY